MEAIIEIEHILVNKQPADANHVDEFVELLERGWKYPPVTVRIDCGIYRLVDGRHRLAALRQLGRTHVRARITL